METRHFGHENLAFVYGLRLIEFIHFIYILAFRRFLIFVHNQSTFHSFFIFIISFPIPHQIKYHFSSEILIIKTIMASQTAGIQQLLAAEKRAAEKINEARKRKAQRLKQAKQEAQAEIEKYREEREKRFREFEENYLGTRDDIAAQIKRETEEALENMNRGVAANKQQVIVRLLQLVCDIRPELHHNLQLQIKLFGKAA